MTETALFRVRRDTLVNWTSTNPIIPDGQLVAESDTGKFKMGDGIAMYLDLPYMAIDGAPGPVGPAGPAIYDIPVIASGPIAMGDEIGGPLITYDTDVQVDFAGSAALITGTIANPITVEMWNYVGAAGTVVGIIAFATNGGVTFSSGGALMLAGSETRFIALDSLAGFNLLKITIRASAV